MLQNYLLKLKLKVEELVCGICWLWSHELKLQDEYVLLSSLAEPFHGIVFVVLMVIT